MTRQSRKSSFLSRKTRQSSFLSRISRGNCPGSLIVLSGIGANFVADFSFLVNIYGETLWKKFICAGMVVKRVCRDCPFPGCGAKYLVKLSNHLADVHQLDHIERRKYLQEAKLQPKVKVVIYHDQNNKDSSICSPKPSWTRRVGRDINYQLSVTREVSDSSLTRHTRKITSDSKNHRKRGNPHWHTFQSTMNAQTI